MSDLDKYTPEQRKAVLALIDQYNRDCSDIQRDIQSRIEELHRESEIRQKDTCRAFLDALGKLGLSPDDCSAIPESEA